MNHEAMDVEDISYSVCLEKKISENNNNPLRYPIPRKIHAWVDDETVETCYGCNKYFSLFLRRHHCRLCGKIFCYECTKNRIPIPENLLSKESKKAGWNDYLSSYVVKIDVNKHRVCNICFDLINKVNSVKRIIDVYKILKLDIQQLKKAGRVCKLWHNASNYCLSLFRELQYKLPSETFNQFEKEMLWNNAKFFAGHAKFLLALIRNCKNDSQYKIILELLGEKKKINCWSLMCTKSCHSNLNSTDAINILADCFREPHFDEQIEKLGLRYLGCTDDELKSYIPFLVYHIRHDQGLLASFLLKRCLGNFALLNSIYWEIQNYEQDYFKGVYTDFLSKLKGVFSQPKYETQFIRLLQGSSFVALLQEVSKEIDNNKEYEELKKTYNFDGEFMIPIFPNVKINKLGVSQAKIKNSATRPLIIPCLGDDNKMYKIMYKKENVRKDQLIMNIINLIDIIVKREENLDLFIVTYNVLPTGSNDGLVEIVNNCDTLYFIQENIKSSILNYILENNGDIKIKDLRDRYIKSTAAYCVITYLLGIGDRHLDNIMITKDGRLFHVDFGFILGKDPVFNNPSIRITPEIVDAIGGFSSVYYPYFKEICTKVYNCIRRNIDIFMNMMLLFPTLTNVNLSEEEIKDQIIKRFIPGENFIDAQLHLVNQLEKQNYTDKIKDWCHYHSKEQTISSGVSRFTTAITSLWTSKK